MFLRHQRVPYIIFLFIFLYSLFSLLPLSFYSTLFLLFSFHTQRGNFAIDEALASNLGGYKSNELYLFHADIFPETKEPATWCGRLDQHQAAVATTRHSTTEGEVASTASGPADGEQQQQPEANPDLKEVGQPCTTNEECEGGACADAAAMVCINNDNVQTSSNRECNTADEITGCNEHETCQVGARICLDSAPTPCKELSDCTKGKICTTQGGGSTSTVCLHTCMEHGDCPPHTICTVQSAGVDGETVEGDDSSTTTMVCSAKRQIGESCREDEKNIEWMHEDCSDGLVCHEKKCQNVLCKKKEDCPGHAFCLTSGGNKDTDACSRLGRRNDGCTDDDSCEGELTCQSKESESGGGGDAAGGVGMSCRGRAQVGESCGADPVGELIPNGPCEKDLACMNTLCTKRGSLGEPCKVYDQSGASSCETGNACFVNVYEGKEEVHCGPLSSPGGPCTEFYHCASGLVCERDSKKETKNTCVAATTTDAPAFKSIARTTTKKKTTISDKYLMAYEAAFN